MASQITGGSEVAVHVYQALYGKAPSYALLNSYTTQATADANGWANQIATGFSSLDDAAFTTLVLGNLGITSTSIGATAYDALAPAVTAYLGAATVANRGIVVMQLGEILSNLEGDATYGAAATAYNNQSLANFNYGSVSTNTSPAAVSPADPTVGQTYMLTTGADTVTGTSGNDTINGNTADTWTGFDAIDGGAGTDTMNVLLTGTAVPGASTITNVENLNVNTTGVGFTIDTTGYTGLTALKLASSAAGAISVTGATTTSASVVGTGASTVNVIGTGGALSVTTGAAAVNVGQTAVVNAITSATIVGGTTVSISDNKTTTKADGTTLTTVFLKGNTGAATLDTDGLTTLTLTNNAQNVTVNAAAGTRALTVNLDGATGGTIADATATTLNVNATGTASTGVTLTAGAATSVAIDAAKNLTVADVNIGAATAVTIAGAGLTTVSATAGVGALTSINASSNTGGVTITPALGTGVLYTGGSGADTITLGATTKAITTGAGDDSVTISASPVGGSIDAGTGTDTLTMTEALAASDSLSVNATFEALISGFEKLSLTTVTGSKTVNLANLDDISYVKTAAATALVLDNLTSGGTVEFSTASTSVTTNISGALAGTADVLNVKATAAAGIDIGTIVSANTETVNFLTDDTATTPTAIQHTADLTDVAAKTITVTGDAGLDLATAGAVAVTSFDASGVTAGAVSWTSAALTGASTVKGGAGNDTLVLTAATAATNLSGGAGNDTLTVNNAKNNTIDGGDGNDTILVGNGNNIITAGAGNDSITLGSGANTVDTGAGTNTVVFAAAMAGLNTITLGSGVDTLDFNAVSTAAGFYPSVTGIAAGDKIDFVGASVMTTQNEATLGAKITLGGAASFANYLDAAAAYNSGASTGAVVNWFQYSGNTYVVLDNSDAITYQDGADLVIELVGTVDLTNSTLATEVLTIV